MTNQVLLLNGIRDSRANTTGLLIPPFRESGYWPVHLERPVTWPWRSYSERYLRRTARHLLLQLPQSREGTLLCHSQGCLQAYYMMLEHAKISSEPMIRNLVFVAPAMERRGWRWNAMEFERMLVVYNASDLAIWLGSLLWAHPFGLAGVRGFATDDIRIEQREDSTLASGFWGHNYFRGEAARDVVDLVADFNGGNLL